MVALAVAALVLVSLLLYSQASRPPASQSVTSSPQAPTASTSESPSSVATSSSSSLGTVWSGTIQGQAQVQPSCGGQPCSSFPYTVSDSGNFSFAVGASEQLSGAASVQTNYTGCSLAPGQPGTVKLDLGLSLAGSVQGSVATVIPTFTSASGLPFSCDGQIFSTTVALLVGATIASFNLELSVGAHSSSYLFGAANDTWTITSGP